MPFTGPIEERNAIRELYDLYADGANRGDRAAWLGCYAEDAVWKTHYFELTGREAMTGNHCPEGWTLYPTPGPKIRNSEFSADFHYYNFVDKYDVMGLGRDTPMINGTNSDSLMALDPATREWVTFRLPYPVPHRLRGRAELLGDRTDRFPL